MEKIKKVSILAYLTPIGFIIAIFKNYKKSTQIGAFHLRQALGLYCVIFITYFIPYFIFGVSADLGIISDLLALICIISAYIFISIKLFIIWKNAIINASYEKMTPIPNFGNLSEKWFLNIIK